MRATSLIMVLLLTSAPTRAEYLGFISMPFSFQGELREAGVPASGNYDISFDLYDDATGGTLLLNTAVLNVPVTAGVFTVTLDFAELMATGAPRFIEVAVAPSGSGAYVVLAPRQRYLPAPVAHRAIRVLDNAVDGDGILDGSVGWADVRQDEIQAAISVDCLYAIVSILPDGTTLCGGGGDSGPPAWELSGNGGTVAGNNFLGTTDDVPLDIRVNDQRAMRYQWGFAGAGGANIIGGTANNAIPNTREASVIAGGGVPAAPNSIDASYAAIGGGIDNQISSSYGVIPGGRGNRVAGSDSLAAGRGARADHANSFVWNDGGTFASTGDNQFLIDAAGGVGIGTNNPSDQLHVSASGADNALRVQINGTTRFRVHNNGGVSVGTNQIPPSAGLLVQGRIRTNSPLTRWLHVGSAAWVPAEPTVVYSVDTNAFEVFEPGPQNAAYAPVQLPHGAVVSELRAVLFDDKATGNLAVSLARFEVTGGGDMDENMAVVSTNGVSSARQTKTDTTINFAVIDNENYVYHLTIDSGTPMGRQAVYGTRITYTTPTLIE